MDQKVTRRQFGRFGIGAASLVAVGAMSTSVLANAPIESTQKGEVPTTGGFRPGPIGINPNPLRALGVKPIAIQIEKAQVDAQVETIEIVDGVMQNPTGPWVVSWYKETAKPGQTGNVVMAGHLDYWDVGPAVFYNIGLLVPDDQINITGEDDALYTYKVESLTNYDVDNAPIQDIVGPTDDESLTLITCGGPFDYDTGHYLQRTVVRSKRI